MHRVAQCSCISGLLSSVAATLVSFLTGMVTALNWEGACVWQVESLLARLRGALPEAPMLGGVLAPNAWGAGHSLRGALFLNSETHDEGAVGCLMRGPLRFDQLCWQVSFYCALLPLPGCYLSGQLHA